MLLAEEMGASLGQIRLETAGSDAIYNNQAAILDALPFRPGDEGAMKRSTEHASGRSATFGELAPKAAQQPLPTQVALKKPADFKLIGQPARRMDGAAKLDGSATFGLDVLPPGLLYASIAMCPTTGGRVASFDATAAQKLPGVRKVMALEPVGATLIGTGATPGGVAVIADTPYHAMRAVKALAIEWDHGPAASLSSAEMIERLSQTLRTRPGNARLDDGDVAGAFRSAAKTIEAEYRVPFLAHATMEPMNCTVQFKDGKATVWAPTQAPGFTRGAAAKALGIDADKVELHVTYLGGGFGRRYSTDFVTQAATLARETGGAPVQLFWSREEDMAHDFYRPAYVARCRAGFDAAGALVAWQTVTAGSSMGAPSLMDTATDGAWNTAYAFPNARVAHVPVESAMPTGVWRSVAHSQNGFFVESFIDECAAAAGKGPGGVPRRAAREGRAPPARAQARGRTLELEPAAGTGARRREAGARPRDPPFLRQHRRAGGRGIRLAGPAGAGAPGDLRRRLRRGRQPEPDPPADGRRHRLWPLRRAAWRDHGGEGPGAAEQLPRLHAAAHERVPGHRGRDRRQRRSARRRGRARHAADRAGGGERGIRPHGPAAAQPAAQARLNREKVKKEHPMTTTLTVNGKAVTVNAEPDTPLLWVLRGEMQLVGTKFGCGKALCGACTVHLDGEPVRSCVTPLEAVGSREVTTIEGLKGREADALRNAWTEVDVVQCGYCQSGQLMSACALLKKTPNPSDDDISGAMSGNICRCGTYPRIRAAIHVAARKAAG
ncbi:molybdopterin-binding domain of aldehyde dehydrogenase domain-containing protein [Ditylenchus destructor]|uniref:Molybdopterin-binding domain of aldehyde dehydrogenase domain-containing protein n=2 Tax=cellular organisms TaxID=131567 RepID=A0AAD4MIW1_9BILA|nr:molybdopterin-binding domain of aldehyde dehydrogenase domain-containing protein [Ditylenchus destructor]